MSGTDSIYAARLERKENERVAERREIEHILRRLKEEEEHRDSSGTLFDTQL